MYSETIWATHPELCETSAAGPSRPRGANRKTRIIAMPHLQMLFINRNTFSGAFTNNKSRSSRLENVLRGKGALEEKKNISSTLASSILRIQSDLVTKQSKMQQKKPVYRSQKQYLMLPRSTNSPERAAIRR